MSVYIDIVLRLNNDVSFSFLWEKLFNQVHRAIVKQLDEEKKSKIGIAFPEYSLENKTLGKMLRLFAPEAESLRLLKKSLVLFKDYIHVTPERPIPSNIRNYVVYKRERVKSSRDRVFRRLEKREKRQKKPLEQIKKELENFEEKNSKCPFINMYSETTKQKFKLFILKQKANGLTDERFGSYGLGGKGSVPEF